MKVLFDSAGAYFRSSSGLSSRSLARFAALAAADAGLSGDVVVLLTGDEPIRKLNREFRGIDKPTDVLSFPSLMEAMLPQRSYAGDLAISIDTAQRQATALGHSAEMEMQVLILHGMLHLAGWDHETDSGEMRRMESRLRRKFGLPAALTERVTASRRLGTPQSRKRGGGGRSAR